MQPEEARALGDLGGEAASAVAAQVRQVHHGIAGRVFGLLGAPAAPVREVHDRVAEAAYTGARLLAGTLVRGGGFVYGLTREVDAPSLEDDLRGRLAVGAIAGAFGDRLAQCRNPLARPASVRRRGADLPIGASAPAREWPAVPVNMTDVVGDARPRLAVFLHGLCETDDAWRLRADRHTPYGDRLESELGYTSVYVRYNSGLHISANGREVAPLLGELVDTWPVPVTEIALIGHSMGGLVARSACHYAGEGSWRERVRHVFMLGSPHKGAPLELAANAACHALSKLPETRGFAAPLKARAVGIKDLGYGYVVDEDWHGHNPDAFWTNTGTVVPFLESASHYFVSATLSRDADAPLSRMFGDLLVLRPSAWSHGGRGERLQFPVAQYSHVGGVNHLELLNHPAVYGQIKRWLTSGRELPTAF